MICPTCRIFIGKGQPTSNHITKMGKKRVRYIRRCPKCGEDIRKSYTEKGDKNVL